MIRGNFALDPGRQQMRVTGGGAVAVQNKTCVYCKYRLLQYYPTKYYVLCESFFSAFNLNA